MNVSGYYCYVEVESGHGQHYSFLNSKRQSNRSQLSERKSNLKHDGEMLKRF